MEDLEYKYLLRSWGDFYNSENTHDYKPEIRYFESEYGLNLHLTKLRELAKSLNIPQPRVELAEGYHFAPVILHRVIEVDGEMEHIKLDIGPCSFEYAEQDLLNWESDYDVYVIDEWISGNFKI